MLNIKTMKEWGGGGGVVGGHGSKAEQFCNKYQLGNSVLSALD